MNRNKRKDKAFTLIELIVAMAIIAILVLLAAPSFLNYTKDAKVTAMEQDTKVLSDAAENYHAINEEWPIEDKPKNIGVGGLGETYPLDEDKINDSIKNIKNDYKDYVISTSGEYTGKVFHVNGIQDKDGLRSYGYVINDMMPDDYLRNNNILNKGDLEGHGTPLIKTNKVYKGYSVYENTTIEGGIRNNIGIRLKEERIHKVHNNNLNVSFNYKVIDYLNSREYPLQCYVTFETKNKRKVRKTLFTNDFEEVLDKDTHNKWVHISWDIPIKEEYESISSFFFFTDYAKLNSKLELTLPTFVLANE